MTIKIFALSVALLAGSVSQQAVAAGTLVVSGDEWQLSSFAFASPYTASVTALATDIANTFGGTNYLLLSGSANVTVARLGEVQTLFTNLGKTATFAASLPVDLSAYDAIFHFGQVVSPTAVANYVNAGGNAYISLGGGYYGSAAAEAAYWNPMLSGFGLVAGSTWFTSGVEPATVTKGPGTSMFWGFGQSIEVLPGNAAATSYLRGSQVGGPTDIGMIGASRSLTGGTVPEPGSWAMLIAGFGLVGATLRRRRAVDLRSA